MSTEPDDCLLGLFLTFEIIGMLRSGNGRGKLLVLLARSYGIWTNDHVYRLVKQM